MFYYSVDNKHNWKYFIFWAKTIYSGLDMTQGEAQAGQGGHHQTSEAELAQVAWYLAQPFQDLALAPQTTSPISSHSQSFETDVNDRKIRTGRIWSPTQILKAFKHFKTSTEVQKKSQKHLLVEQGCPSAWF